MVDNNDLTFQYKSAYGGQYTLKPFLGMYANNGNLSVGFLWLDKPNDKWFPFCYATVNIIPLAYLEGTIDVNDNGIGFLDFLEKNGFGERTSYGVQSGFCSYPIFKFNEALIRRIDPKVFADYAKTFGKKALSLDTQITSAEQKQQTAKQENNKEPER